MIADAGRLPGRSARFRRMRQLKAGLGILFITSGASFTIALFDSAGPFEHALAIPSAVVFCVAAAAYGAVSVLLDRADRHLRSSLACLSRERVSGVALREWVGQVAREDQLPEQRKRTRALEARIEDGLRPSGSRRHRAHVEEFRQHLTDRQIDDGDESIYSQHSQLGRRLDRIIEAIDAVEKLVTNDHRSVTGSGD